MKKIIDGKRYDTEASKKLAEVGGRDGTFRWSREALYQKRTGEFFLFGEGGAASKYARQVGYSEWAPGERIMPLTVEEAMKWAEENLDADEYESIFGEAEEEPGRSIATYSLANTTIKRVAELAALWGCSKSEVIDRLIGGQNK